MTISAVQPDEPREPGPPRISRAMMEELRARLRAEQRPLAGLVAGLLAALFGAMAWAAISIATDYQIGFMAIALGLFVGATVRRYGRGIDPSFRLIGAACALLGCVIGNLLTVVGVVAKQDDASFLHGLGRLDADVLFELMSASFSGIDLLFYGFAAVEGFKLAVFPIDHAAVARALGTPPTSAPPTSAPPAP